MGWQLAGRVNGWAARQASGRQRGEEICRLAMFSTCSPTWLQLFYDDEHGNIRRVSTLGVCSILVGAGWL